MTEWINRAILDEANTGWHDNLPSLPPRFSAEFSRPAEVLINWNRTENQARIGSCNGVAWTEVLEKCHYVATGEVVQLSKIFMYLKAQEVGGLLGADRGSRPSDGGRVALNIGCCPEDLTGYPQSYPNRSQILQYLSKANTEAGSPFKALSLWKATDSHDEDLDFLGGGGSFVFGIKWWDGLIPGDRVVRSYNPRGKRILGGHAMAGLGYTRDGDIRAKNSHNDGEYLITPDAWRQMKSDQGTSICGALGSTEPVMVDWYQDSPYFD